MGAKATEVLTETILHVALEHVHESPTNKRRTWGNLDELATSIEKVGVQQPGLARPMPTADDPDALELVFGHRRLRATKKTKRKTMPLIIRELSDAAALEIQAVENLQRTDLHELEEAEGFEQLVQVGWSAKDVAARLGKSHAYVYARLQLLKLVPEARDAFYAERLTASVALEVARVPPSMQLEALQLLEDEAEAEDFDWTPEEKGGRPAPLRAREAATLLRKRYTLRLVGAPFDRQDAQLVPAAGACTSCPKRSGAQPELFGDVGSPDVCTDPTCFDGKRIAATTKARDRLEAKGVTVLEGRRAHGHTEAPAGFVTVDAQEWSNGRLLKIADLVKKKTVAKKLGARVVMLGDNGKPVDLYKKAEVLKAAGIKVQERGNSSYKPPSPEQIAADARKRDAAHKAEKLALEQTMAAFAKLEGPALTRALRVAVKSIPTWHLREVVQRRGWKGVDANIDKLDARALCNLLVEVCVEDIGTLALHLKIDVKALEKAELEKLKAADKAKAEKPAKKAATKGGQEVRSPARDRARVRPGAGGSPSVRRGRQRSGARRPLPCQRPHDPRLARPGAGGGARQPSPRGGIMNDDEKASRTRELLKQESDEPEVWWWLSFADAELPKGQQFLGACVVRAHGLIGATLRAHALGINPGGEVLGQPAPPHFFVQEGWADRLLSRDECASFDRAHRVKDTPGPCALRRTSERRPKAMSEEDRVARQMDKTGMDVGIYRKFIVSRTDGSSRVGGKHETCAYFVLDWDHDPFAVEAARAYADACEKTHPALASDLRTLADRASVRWALLEKGASRDGSTQR